MNRAVKSEKLTVEFAYEEWPIKDWELNVWQRLVEFDNIRVFNKDNPSWPDAMNKITLMRIIAAARKGIEAEALTPAPSQPSDFSKPDTPQD